MARILLRLVFLVLGIFVSAYLLPGVVVRSLDSAILAAVLLGILNISIKPVLVILTLPINILSLGLFTFLINGFLVWFAGQLVPGFEVTGFFTSILASVIISILNLTLNGMLE